MCSAPTGRFAPSPTGPLHLGSLSTALASWVDCRQRHGRWLLRIDDIDPPREVAGAAALIAKQLQAHGLHWDGDICFQSQRQQAYANAIKQLLANHSAFYCPLSRKQLLQWGGRHPGPGAVIQSADASSCAIRLEIPDNLFCFDDRLQGKQNVTLNEGAFVIQRKDGFYAYQLACALDDAQLGITDVVRGIDLLPSTARQLLVIKALGLSPPRYGHLPVLVNQQGEKFSKSSGAAALSPKPTENLLYCLKLMGLSPPETSGKKSVQRILQWALENLDIEQLRGQRMLTVYP